MNSEKEISYTDFVLPSNLVTKNDIALLLDDAERVDNRLTESTVKSRVANQPISSPAISARLQDFLTQNQIQFQESLQRSNLIRELRKLKDNLQMVHMTFAVTADQQSLEQVISWVRQNISKQAVISVGLQPSLVAGVYVRTTNKVFDLSLRNALKGKRAILINAFSELRSGR